MKKALQSMFIAFILVFALGLAIATAGERILIATADSVVTQLDKTGNEYTRIIIQENKILQGVAYTVGIPVMFFGQTSQAGSAIAKGDSFKCIVSENIYQGRKNYSVIAVLK